MKSTRKDDQHIFRASASEIRLLPRGRDSTSVTLTNTRTKLDGRAAGCALSPGTRAHPRDRQANAKTHGWCDTPCHTASRTHRPQVCARRIVLLGSKETDRQTPRFRTRRQITSARHVFSWTPQRPRRQGALQVQCCSLHRVSPPPCRATQSTQSPLRADTRATTGAGTTGTASGCMVTTTSVA